MYKYLISKWADPVFAVVIGLVAFKQYEFKEGGPTLLQLLQEKYAKDSENKTS